LYKKIAVRSLHIFPEYSCGRILSYDKGHIQISKPQLKC
jgi:hypothetical protein